MWYSERTVNAETAGVKELRMYEGCLIGQEGFLDHENEMRIHYKFQCSTFVPVKSHYFRT